MNPFSDTLLQSLARQHGTPLWVYDAATIRARIAELRAYLLSACDQGDAEACVQWGQEELLMRVGSDDAAATGLPAARSCASPRTFGSLPSIRAGRQLICLAAWLLNTTRPSALNSRMGLATKSSKVSSGLDDGVEVDITASGREGIPRGLAGSIGTCGRVLSVHEKPGTRPGF